MQKVNLQKLLEKETQAEMEENADESEKPMHEYRARTTVYYFNGAQYQWQPAVVTMSVGR